MGLGLIIGGAVLVLAWWWTRPKPTQNHALPPHTTSAAEERARIYRDIHDDIGSKLLTLLHTTQDETQADLVRTIMQDLRDVVSRSAHSSGSLLEILGQIRDETEQRLELAGGQLQWEVGTDLPDPDLDEGQALHLLRISREAVTNALRHGSAHHLRIRARCDAEQLTLDYTDDGHPIKAPAGQGRGLKNMRERASELHGRVDWTTGTAGGTKVVLKFPLPAASPPD